MEPFHSWESARTALAEAKEMLGDPELGDMAKEDIQPAAISDAVETIRALSRRSRCRPSAMIEIRAGAGGDEASIFVGNLVRVRHVRHAKLEISISKAMVNRVATKSHLPNQQHRAYGLMRYESGGHRVQRVPATESWPRTTSLQLLSRYCQKPRGGCDITLTTCASTSSVAARVVSTSTKPNQRFVLPTNPPASSSAAKTRKVRWQKAFVR